MKTLALLFFAGLIGGAAMGGMFGWQSGRTLGDSVASRSSPGASLAEGESGAFAPAGNSARSRAGSSFDTEDSLEPGKNAEAARKRLLGTKKGRWDEAELQGLFPRLARMNIACQWMLRAPEQAQVWMGTIKLPASQKQMVMEAINRTGTTVFQSPNSSTTSF